MHILFLFPYAPLPPPHDLAGNKRNIPFLIEAMKRHEVSVISFGTEADERAFRSSIGSTCRRVHFVPRPRTRLRSAARAARLLMTGRALYGLVHQRAMEDAITRVCAEERVDLIHACTHRFGVYQFPPGIPVVTDTHEVEHEVAERTARATRNPVRRLLALHHARVGRPEEIALTRRFDALVATQDRDGASFARWLPAGHVHVIPNGVGPEFLSGPPEPIRPRSIVFTGKMSFYPNDHGIRFFIDEVLPLICRSAPDTTLDIVGLEPGRALRRRATDRIRVHGFVEDVRPWMARAEVFIIPLKIGGGIRGKALEAMAMRKAIVTTSVGVEALGLRHEETALFGETPDDLARCVLRIFADAALRDRLGAASRALVESRYNWTVQGEKMETVYRSLAPHPTSTEPS